MEHIVFDHTRLDLSREGDVPQEVELLHLADSDHHLGLGRGRLHQGLAVGSVAVVHFMRVGLANFLGVDGWLLDGPLFAEDLADVVVLVFLLAAAEDVLASLDAVLDE